MDPSEETLHTENASAGPSKESDEMSENASGDNFVFDKYAEVMDKEMNIIVKSCNEKNIQTQAQRTIIDYISIVNKCEAIFAESQIDEETLILIRDDMRKRIDGDISAAFAFMYNIESSTEEDREKMKKTAIDAVQTWKKIAETVDEFIRERNVYRGKCAADVEVLRWMGIGQREALEENAENNKSTFGEDLLAAMLRLNGRMGQWKKRKQEAEYWKQQCLRTVMDLEEIKIKANVDDNEIIESYKNRLLETHMEQRFDETVAEASAADSTKILKNLQFGDKNEEMDKVINEFKQNNQAAMQKDVNGNNEAQINEAKQKDEKQERPMKTYERRGKRLKKKKTGEELKNLKGE